MARAAANRCAPGRGWSVHGPLRQRFPKILLSLQPDYAMTHMLTPIARTTTAMRCRARVVEAVDRGSVIGEARRWAHVAQLLEGQPAVDDVPPDQAVLVLELVGPDYVAVQDRGP